MATDFGPGAYVAPSSPSVNPAGFGPGAYVPPSSPTVTPAGFGPGANVPASGPTVKPAGFGPGTVIPGDSPVAPPAPTGPTDIQKNARDIVNDTLNSYGLASLSDWAWNEILAGSSPSQVLLDLQNQQAFKDAFPEIQAQRAKGLTPFSPGQIINYRQDATQRMRAAGLPEGFWDSPDDFANLITNEISTDELQHRIDLARQATYELPQQTRDVLARDYGITDGHWTANFLDPTQAEPLLQQHFLAAQIGGTAALTGYDTSRTQNERLAALGITPADAQRGFNQLANSRELFGSLPGENTTGISPDEQLAATFEGNADAQRKITRRQQERQAVFAAGGSYAAGQGGVSGVGAAQGA